MVSTQKPGSPELSVQWNDPANSESTFMFDPMHFPFPLSPLFQTVLAPGFRAGFTAAFRHYNAPIDRFDCTYRNNYHFERYVPKVPKDNAEAQAIDELAEKTFQAAIPGMVTRWQDVHMPAILAIDERLRSIAATSPREAATPANVEAVKSALGALWTEHFVIVLPMLLAMELFDEFYAELFGADADSHKLLAGMESESVKTGYELSDLAALARSLELAEMLRETPVEEIPAALQQSEAGREFAGQLYKTLKKYGLRQDLFDFLVPTWVEDPTVPLLQIRQYLVTGRDNRVETARLAGEAAAATAEAREALAGFPEAARGQFEAFLQFSRDAMFLQEEHNFYIDQQAHALARLALMNIGKGLVERGILDQPQDVFMLTYEQLVAATGGGSGDFRAIAAQAWADHERSALLTPPPFVGPPPQGPPPMDNPFARGIMRFFGGPPQESGDPNKIKGNAGSRGEVTGAAFVARTLEAATGIQPGQILVTITTMPPWTPLFGIAAAVVTETGGPLSHCAIVAREYGIPAVVGAHGAVSRIRSGQTITVDGSNGVVTLHD